MQRAGIKWRWRPTQFYFPLSGNNQNKTKRKSIAGIWMITGAKLWSFIFWPLQRWESMILPSLHSKYYFMAVFNVLMCSTIKYGCGIALHAATTSLVSLIISTTAEWSGGEAWAVKNCHNLHFADCRCWGNVYFMRRHSVRTNSNGCCSIS